MALYFTRYSELSIYYYIFTVVVLVGSIGGFIERNIFIALGIIIELANLITNIILVNDLFKGDFANAWFTIIIVVSLVL